MGETHNHSIVLMGLKHCGKSTQGRRLAQEMELDFFDTDDVIEKNVGKSVQMFYKTKGASEFMREEEKACAQIVEENVDKQIIVATGGGICDNPPALTKLRELGTFVFLKLDIEFSIERVMGKINMVKPGKFTNVPAYVEAERPKTLKDVRAIMTKKYEERLAHYESIADIVVNIKNAPIEENFKLILGAVR